MNQQQHTHHFRKLSRTYRGLKQIFALDYAAVKTKKKC